MILLPIVVRELRVAARRKSVYRARFWTAFTTVAIGSYVILGAGVMMGRAQGAMVFSTLTTLCLLSCLSLGGNTSDCISEEKREGTLGFLFLTDLKGHDIALGKLVSASLLSFYAIIGVFPIVAVSLLLGGVSAKEFWEVALALLNAFFFSHCAGLFVSALSRKRNSASMGAGLLLLFYSAGLFALSAVAETRHQAWASVFETFNPAYAVYWACTMGYNFRAQIHPYWSSLVIVNLNAWLFLVLASWWLPRCWQEKASKGRVGWSQRLRLWYHARSTPRSQLLDANPFLWLTIRNRLSSIKLWAALSINSGFWIWLLVHLSATNDGAVPMLCGLIIVNHLVLKISAAGEVTGNLEEQRRSGGLELLLSCTPLSVDQIIEGQWLAVKRQFLQPTLATLAADLAIVFWFIGQRMNNMSVDDKASFVFFVLAVMVMLLVDLYALVWMGMWNAMSQKKPRHAAGATVSQIILLPWLILIMIAVISGLGRIPIFDSFGSLLAIWFMVGLAVDVGALSLFRSRLISEFRALASVQADEALGLLGRLGRFLGTMAR